MSPKGHHVTQCAQNALYGNKLFLADPFIEKSRQIHRNTPTPGELGGICRFLHMLQKGPGIARRADRVGVLPLAPLVLQRTKTISETPENYHLWAHSVLNACKYVLECTVGPDWPISVTELRTHVPLYERSRIYSPKVPTTGNRG